MSRILRRDVSHYALAPRVQWARRRLDKAETPKERDYWEMVLDDLRRDVCLETPAREMREREIDSLRRFAERLDAVLAKTPRYVRFVAREAEKRRKKAKRSRRRARHAEQIAREAEDEAVIASFLHRGPELPWVDQILDAPVDLVQAKKALARFHRIVREGVTGPPCALRRSFIAHLDRVMGIVSERMIGRLLGRVPSEAVLQFVRILSTSSAFDVVERIRADLIDTVSTGARVLSSHVLIEEVAASDVEAMCLDQGSVFERAIVALDEESLWATSLFADRSSSAKVRAARVRPLGTCRLRNSLSELRETVRRLGCVAMVYRPSACGSSTDISVDPPVLALLKDGSVAVVNGLLWDRGPMTLRAHAVAARVPEDSFRRDIS